MPAFLVSVPVHCRLSGYPIVQIYNAGIQMILKLTATSTTNRNDNTTKAMG